jgi:hypothetical protein
VSVREAGVNQEFTLIFEQLDIAGVLVTGQAGAIGVTLRDEDGAASEGVTIAEQGTDGYYTAKFTPTKSSELGFAYYLRLVSPATVTDEAILNFEIRVRPSVSITAAAGTELTTLANLKEYLRITTSTHDALLASLIVRVSRLLEKEWGYPVKQATYIEQHDGSGMPKLAFRFPIVTVNNLWQSIDHVFDATTLIASSDYVVKKPSGIIYLKNGGVFFWGFQNVKIDYDAGYAAIPGEIEQIAIEAMARAFRRSEAPDVVSMSLKDGSMTKMVTPSLFSKEERRILTLNKDWSLGVF